MNKKQNDIESLKELLYTYEKTMEHKDNIITNMTKAIQKQVNTLFARCELKFAYLRTECTSNSFQPTLKITGDRSPVKMTVQLDFSSVKICSRPVIDTMIR